VLSNEADRLKRVIVCTPSEEYFKISNLKSHNIFICLGDGELIVGDTNLEAIHCLNEEQFTIHLIDISEFVKGAGGPNCLIMPLTRDANP